MRTLVATATAITAMIVTPVTLAEEHEPTKRNPALSYWQAAAQLPELSDGKAEELREVAAGKATFTPEILEGLDFSQTETLLRKAAASEVGCDWGLAFEDGPEMSAPHLAKMREFATITLVLAEAEFAAGEAAAGIDLLMLTHRLARDSGASDHLIGYLVQVATERLAIGAAARHCMAWDAAERRGYAQQLAALPALHPLHKAYARESMFIDWFEARVGDDFESIGEKLGIPAGGGKRIQPADDMISEMRELHARALAIFQMQGDGRRQAAAKLENEVADTKNLLVAVLMPTITGMIAAQEKTTAARHMLELALEHGAEISQQDLDGTGFNLVREDVRLKMTSDSPKFSLQFGSQ